MNTFHFLFNLLTPTQAWGAVASLFLLAVSFVAVHAVKLANRGYSSYQKQTDEKKTEEKPKEENEPSPAPEPIYYLVEKKQVKKKPVEYDAPKRIRIEKED